MKKKFCLILYVLLFVGIVISLTACSKNASLKGIWKCTSTEFYDHEIVDKTFIIFDGNQTAKFENDYYGVSYEGSYTLNDNIVTIRIENTSLEGKLSGNELIFYHPDELNDTWVFQKQ